MKAGAILTVDAPAFELIGVEGYQPDEVALKQVQAKQIEIALDAIIKIKI